MKKTIKKRLHKFLSIALALIFIIGLLPAVSTPASAADDEEDALAALGFDTAEAPDGYDSSSESSPYGTAVTTVSPVSELYVSGGSVGVGTLYGDDVELGVDATELFGSGKNVGSSILGPSAAVAGSFDGSGLDGQVAALQYSTANSRLLLIFKEIENSTSTYTSKTVWDGESTEFANGGTTVEDTSTTSVLLQNYLQISAGDFNGDGTDEIAVYIPEQGSPRVVVYQLQPGDGETWGTSAAWVKQYTYDLSYDTYVPNQVSLTAGDMNGDGVDDLGITWGAYFMPAYSASKAVVLCGSKSSDSLFDDTHTLSLGTVNGYGFVRVSMALGDADGDGKNELVISGQSIYDLADGQDRNPYTRYIAVYEYNSTTSSFVCSASTNVDLKSSSWGDGDYSIFLSFPKLRSALAVVKKDGIGTQEYVYVDGVLFLLTDEGFTPSQPVVTNLMMMETIFLYNVTAADFNGDGQETIAAMLCYNSDNGYNYEAIHCETDYSEFEEGDTIFTVLSSFVGSGFCIAAPNTDNDTMVMEYTGEHELVYSEPEVLAVVAAPPYFGDLEHLDGGDDYVGNSETSYASSTGSGSSGSSSKTISAGIYCSLEEEFSFYGLKAASFEVEREVTFAFTKEYEQSKETTQTIEYSTMGGQDTVVLYSIPIDVYYYTAYMPTDSGEPETQTMTVSVPYTASVKTLTVEAYDTIAENYDSLPAVGGSILESTPGDPSSYPGSTAEYTDVAIYDGNYAGVGYGSSSSITQTLEMATETATTRSYSLAINNKAGAGAGGLTIGVVVGGEAGWGNTSIDLTGSSFSGTVVNMPAAAEEYSYGYNWKIFEYMYTDDDNTFPVVSYVVNSVTTPPELPSDFSSDPEALTSDSITLTWKSDDPTVAGFQLYRHYEFPDGEGDFAQGDVISDYDSYDPETGEYTYSYTDTGLEAYNEYQYRIQSISGTAPHYSVLSDMLSVYTAPGEGQPEITLSDKSLQLYPDDRTELSVTVTNDAVNARAPLYQWQKLADDAWVSLTGETGSALTFADVGISDAGTYRCRVNQLVGTYYISAYSDSVEVGISKRVPAIVLTAEDNPNDDMTPVITAAISNTGTSGSIPSGTVTFKITGSTYTQTVTMELDSSGKAALSDWTAPEEGYYAIAAEYSGNRVFKTVSAGTSFIAGSSVGFGMVVFDKICYGDSLTPVVTVYDAANATEKTLSATEAIDGYSLSYEIYRSTSYIEDPAAIEAYVKDQAGSNLWLQLALYATYCNIYAPPVWLLTNAGADDGIITPTAADEYRVAAIIKNEGGTVVKTLTRDFTVSPRPLTITAPSDTVSQSDVSQPVTSQLTITDGSLGFSDSYSSLGIDVACVNSAGTTVTLSSATSPGVYTTTVTKSFSSSYIMAQKNYDFTFVSGTYTVTGPTYPVTISGQTLLGKTVGSPVVLSPEGYAPGAEYQYGTEIVFAAYPDSGYEVSSWTVNGVSVDPETLTNPNLLTKTMQNEAMTVSVAYRVQQATLTFDGDHGGVECVDSAMLQSGDNVIAGASYTFKAVPDAGYHFKEWRLYAGGLSYPADAEDTDGFHTCTLTMGAVSANLMAVFERDSYVLSLGDHLVASYYWDDDDDSTTPDVKKYVSSGTLVLGDTEVTVEPAAGYLIADDEKWYADGIAVTTVKDDPATDEDETVYYSGQSYIFIITQDTEITADSELQNYDVTVSTGWTGSGTDTGENAVSVSVDGNQTDLDSLTELAGGSAVTFTAVPAYGAIFDHWSVNGATIDPDTLADPQVYTCVALGEDLEVVAVFKQNNAYTVSVSKEAHGALSYSLNGGDEVPLGSDAGTISIPVYEGDTLIFTAAPDTEFMVGGWTVDGTWYQTTSKTCLLSNIDSDRTLSLNFAAKIYYTVEFSAGDHGSVSAVMDDNYTLTSGERPGGGTVIEFTATPNAGYMVAGWTANGKTVKNEYGSDYVGSVYTIDALSEDTTVSVTFETEQSWTVTLPAEQDHYTLSAVFSPDSYSFAGTSGTVRNGASAVVTVTPDEGYLIDSVDISGDTISAFDDTDQTDGTWACTLNSVTEDLTVSVTAEATYSVTVATVTGGTATADPALCIAGTRVDIAASPLSNYTFSGWTVSGAAVIDDADAAETYFIMPAENVTVTPAFTYTGGGSTNPGGGSTNPGGSAEDEDEGDVITITDAEGNSAGGTRTDTETGVTVIIPREDFDDLAVKSDSDVTIDLGIVKVTFDAEAVDSISDSSDTGDISLMVEEVDVSTLSAEARALIGDRPVYDFTLMAGDTQISELGGKATVNVPYTLQADEDPNAVVIYYIDDSGKLKTVRGKYNAETGTVDFTVTHFSVYAVGYHEVTFNDVADTIWYFDAVTFCAARGITTGTGENEFSPNATLTRAQFIVMLMRAYGIEADESSTDNFDDAGDAYYTGYLAAAKRLGISNGVGDNMYAPEREISRQDMFTLLYRALEVLEELPVAGTTSSLSDFSDADLISDYAVEAVGTLVSAGIVSGSNGQLDPLGNSIRAQMAQVIFNILFS